ncbi:MAG: M48 family metallopeptidase [Nitratireductor sp.]|nr:M48 family metallopeptidase [Nitratireductor sp.]
MPARLPVPSPTKRLAALIVLVLSLIALPAASLAQSLPLVRDAEIEGLLKSYTEPLFRAGGLGKGAVDVYIVNNRNFNAFVTDRRMFIHTGALMQAETPNEIIGVIAHETGHIIGGHQARMRDRIEKAKLLAAVGVLMGAGAMAAGGDLGDAAGQAILSGGRDSLMRTLLAYQRDEETSADRAAITLLDKTGQSGAGMLKTFDRMGSELLFSSSRIDPYIQSHPLPRERVALLQTLVTQSPNYARRDPEALQIRHDMARAKIAAYSGGLGMVRRLFRDDRNAIAARYGTAIAQYLQGNPKAALQTINKLIQQMPNYAYLYEMKAEILVNTRKADDAVAAMQTAIKLDPYQSGLLRIQYGHVLLESGKRANVDEAIRQIKAGLARDPQTLSGYGYLARAYSTAGDEARAMAATAEARFLVGNHKEARQFAMRAQQQLNKNSPEWVRMQDIVLYKPKKKSPF